METVGKIFSDIFSLSRLSNLLVYLAIIIVFIVGFSRCIAPVMVNRGVLRKAIRSIRSKGDNKYAWQAEKFLGKGALYAHWTDYLNNLFFADGIYHNASNVADYINEDTVIYGPGHAAFADAIPSLCVSLGFLGTLIGLAQGLSGFSMEDSAAVQNSIVTLIPGMKYAFTTSIVGVIASLLFTLIIRYVYGSSEHTIKRFYAAMSNQAGVISVDPMTQIAIYQQEQTELIKNLTTQIPEEINKVVAPIEKTLCEFMNVNTKEQMRFIDSIIMRFADRMDESTNGAMKRFGTLIEDTNANLRESVDAVRASVTAAQTSVKDLQKIEGIAQELFTQSNGYIEELRRNQKFNEETFERMGEAVDQLGTLTQQQGNYLKTVSAMQTEVAHNVQNMNAALTEFAAHFKEDAAAAAGSMQRASNELRATGQVMENAHIKTAKAIESELNATMDAYRDYVNQFTKRVDYLANSISAAVKHLPDAVQNTSGRFLDEMDQLTQTLARVNDEFRRGSDRR